VLFTKIKEEGMKKSLFIMLIVIMTLAVLLTSVSCAKKKDTILRIGTNAEYPPFEFKQDNQFAGVDMDLVKTLAEKMGVKYEIIDMDFDALIPSLTSNKIDLAASAITITDERKQQVDFSLPYYTANQVIIAKQDSPLKVTKPEDIVKYKVGAQNGTTGQIYVQENLVDKKLMKKDNLKKYSTNIEAITDMLNGNIDFVIIDDSAAQGYSKLKPINILYKIETNEEYGLALQKNSPFKDKINTALDELIKSGEVVNIIANNFK
jgi:polar amino acid transport system substrate-binding protein